MIGHTEAACLENLKMCISKTVAMRHPNPMEHIARMLVDPNFQDTLDPPDEYVRRHDLEERLTKALGLAGFPAGQPEPPDLLKRLYEQILAGADTPPAAAHREVVEAAARVRETEAALASAADPQVLRLGAPPAAHSEAVRAAVRAAQEKLENAPLPSEGEGGSEPDTSSAWSCQTWAAPLPLGELLIKALCGPVEELVKDWPAHTRSAAELEYVRRLFKDISASQDPDSQVAALLRPALAACTKELVDAGMKLIEDVVTEEELSDKFCTEKGKELIFGGLDSFNAGLEAVVGPPNSDLWGAIRKEHTDV